MKEEWWNFWCWNAFNHKLYSESITTDDVLDDKAVEFHESLVMLESNNSVEYTVPESFRECVRVVKDGEKYLLPLKFADALPLKVTNEFKCQIKKYDRKVWKFITGVTSLSISGDSYGESFKQFVNSWNPIKHSEPDHWTFIKLLSVASVVKPIKVCLCSEPNTGKNSNFTIIGKILGRVGRFGTPTLAVFERSLYYNTVTIIDEITSIAPSQMRELEPVILTVSDNSPEYRKHSLAQQSFLNRVDLGKCSLVFPYNRKKDVDKTGGKFFDEVWNNIPALKSRFPQLLVKGVVEEFMPNLNKAEAKKMMEDNFDSMRKVAKQLVYWKDNLHKHKHDYKLKIILSNRHLTNLQSIIDVMDAYSESQAEFDQWCSFLLMRIDAYKQMLNTGEYSINENNA